jgi:hypothetical protein
MFRDPWFYILEVHDAPGRRSMADIAMTVANERGLPLGALRGERRDYKATSARHEAFCRVRAERPDISSNQAGLWFRCRGSNVRHAWAKNPI